MKLAFAQAALAAPLAVLAALAASPASPASGAVRPPGLQPGTGALAGHRVTLLTGGKVTAEDHGGARPGIVVTPGRVRPGVPFHISTVPTAPGSRPRAGTPTYLVRVRVLDRAGQPLPPPPAGQFPPAYSLLGTVLNTATGAAVNTAGVPYNRKAGVYLVRLPAGDYYLDGMATTKTYTAGMAEPDAAVHGNTTIILDARTAVPVITSVGHPGAKTLLDQVEIDQTVAGKGFSSAYGLINSPGAIEPFYFTPTAPVTGRPFVYSLHTSLTTPGAFPTARHLVPAGYEYNLVFTHEGSVPASLDYRVASGQLAAVQTRYYTQRATLPSVDSAQQASLPLAPGDQPGDELYLSFDSPVVIAAAGQATMYYNAAPHVQWFRNYLINDVHADPSDIAPLEAFTPGHTYQRGFDAAGLAPAGVAERQGNTLFSFPSPFSAAEPGHYMPALSGLSEDGSGVTTRLSLNGKVIGRSIVSAAAAFPVPAAPGRYTLTEVASRPASTWSVLGTSSTAVWTFFSGHRASLGALPLLTVRAAGPVSSCGALPAAKTVPLSLTVQQIPHGARLTSLTVSASSDGGKNWRPLHVYRVGQRWLALETTPASGYVSLRTSATDSAGDAAVITTIRAFAVG